jgi:hypothetical protein
MTAGEDTEELRATTAIGPPAVLTTPDVADNGPYR